MTTSYNRIVKIDTMPVPAKLIKNINRKLYKYMNHNSDCYIREESFKLKEEKEARSTVLDTTVKSQVVYEKEVTQGSIKSLKYFENAEKYVKKIQYIKMTTAILKSSSNDLDFVSILNQCFQKNHNSPIELKKLEFDGKSLFKFMGLINQVELLEATIEAKTVKKAKKILAHELIGKFFPKIRESIEENLEMMAKIAAQREEGGVGTQAEIKRKKIAERLERQKRDFDERQKFMNEAMRRGGGGQALTQAQIDELNLKNNQGNPNALRVKPKPEPTRTAPDEVKKSPPVKTTETEDTIKKKAEPINNNTAQSDIKKEVVKQAESTASVAVTYQKVRFGTAPTTAPKQQLPKTTEKIQEPKMEENHQPRIEYINYDLNPEARLREQQETTKRYQELKRTRIYDGLRLKSKDQNDQVLPHTPKSSVIAETGINEFREKLKKKFPPHIKNLELDKQIKEINSILRRSGTGFKVNKKSFGTPKEYIFSLQADNCLALTTVSHSREWARAMFYKSILKVFE